MKFCRVLFLLAAVSFSFARAEAGSTFLAEKTVPITSTRSSDVLSRTVADVKDIFLRFELALDSSSTIVEPLKVTGPANKPVMTVTVKKCVAFICQTMDLDAEITIDEKRANCDRNFLMQANLRRSSEGVRDLYDRLDVAICYKAQADGKGSLLLRASVNHGPKYNEGFIQKELFKMLQMQVAPIVKALQETLKAKE